MKAYIRNNIQFRIVSSNAIAKFKAGQAFDFNEITNVNSTFAPSTREVLLLEYEYGFKLILRLEKLFLMLSENEKMESLEKTLITSIDYLMSDIEEVMSSYPDQFDSVLIQYMENFHEAYKEVLESQIKSALCDNIYSAYPKIVNFISTYLQQAMFVLHDFDNNTISKREEPFLSLTNASVEKILALPKSTSHIVERAKFFNSKFNINKFILKNYSSYNEIKDITYQLKQADVLITDVKNLDAKATGE